MTWRTQPLEWVDYTFVQRVNIVTGSFNSSLAKGIAQSYRVSFKERKVFPKDYVFPGSTGKRIKIEIVLLVYI